MLRTIADTALAKGDIRYVCCLVHSRLFVRMRVKKKQSHVRRDEACCFFFFLQSLLF